MQAFTPLWVEIDDRYDRYYTRTIESISPMLHLEGNSLFSGLYINELLYYALSPASPDESLFNAYLMTLNGLALASDRLEVESLLRRFEWTLLKTCGYSFSLTQEARSGALIDASRQYQFVAGEGFICVSKGIPGEHLLALAEDNLDDEALLKSAKQMMRSAIDHLLGGREIKARTLYR
ncbi:DNA repair protein RecO [Legionella antarctica]|uniref:DNA repair protein RecO n=1 Tax=Legionella antarctica TaxID=2708020 RepID=A0A6F8T666_9GAMM|nr:DNA repair protein RecO [Legionella antarctica]